MNEAITNYDRIIARLNMLMVVCGVMSTLSMTALTSSWDQNMYGLVLIFTILVTAATGACVIGLFSKRIVEGPPNPKDSRFDNVESLESFLTSSIDLKIRAVRSHMKAADHVWRFIRIAYVMLSLALFVIVIIAVLLMMR